MYAQKIGIFLFITKTVFFVLFSEREFYPTTSKASSLESKEKSRSRKVTIVTVQLSVLIVLDHRALSRRSHRFNLSFDVYVRYTLRHLALWKVSNYRKQMSISIIFSNLFIVRIDFLTLTPVLGVSSPNNGSGKAPFGDEYDGWGYDPNSHHHEGHDDVVIREFAVTLVILVIA